MTRVSDDTATREPPVILERPRRGPLYTRPWFVLYAASVLTAAIGVGLVAYAVLGVHADLLSSCRDCEARAAEAGTEAGTEAETAETAGACESLGELVKARSNILALLVATVSLIASLGGLAFNVFSSRILCAGNIVGFVTGVYQFLKLNAPELNTQDWSPEAMVQALSVLLSQTMRARQSPCAVDAHPTIVWAPVGFALLLAGFVGLVLHSLLLFCNVQWSPRSPKAVPGNMAAGAFAVGVSLCACGTVLVVAMPMLIHTPVANQCASEDGTKLMTSALEVLSDRVPKSVRFLTVIALATAVFVVGVAADDDEESVIRSATSKLFGRGLSIGSAALVVVGSPFVAAYLKPTLSAAAALSNATSCADMSVVWCARLLTISTWLSLGIGGLLICAAVALACVACCCPDKARGLQRTTNNHAGWE